MNGKKNNKPMKVLLINPLTDKEKLCNVLPNLGLGYLATSLRKEKIEVEIIDGYKRGMNEKLIKNMLKNNNYQAVGFQVFITSVNKTREYLDFIKSLNKNIVTIVGGPHPSSDRENILQYLPNADFGIAGEGEESLPQLLKLIENGEKSKSYYNIQNLIWRKDREIISNPVNYIQNLDNLGLPAWDLINPLEYPQAPMGVFVKSFPVAPINTGRGCMYSCSFCSVHSVMGKKRRCRSKDSIIEEIKLLKDKYNVKEIHIIDDNFTLNKKVVRELCEEIIHQNIKLNFSLPNGIRLNTLDKEILCLLEKAGWYSIGIGIESGSERILSHMRKRQTIQEIKDKVSLISKSTKIRITGFFIIGYPEETEEDILKTIKLSKELPLSRAQFLTFTPLPGSEIYNILKQENRLNRINYDSTIFHTLCYIPYKISPFKIKFLRIKAYFEFYVRPKVFLGILKEIKSLQQLKFLFRKVKILFK